MKPLLYIPWGVLSDTSPFSVTQNPLRIQAKGCFIFFDDENFHYAVEYTQPAKGEGGLEGISRLAPWGPGDVSGAKKVSSERELRSIQNRA